MPETPLPSESRWTQGLLWGLLLVGLVDQLRLVLAYPDHAFESGIWSALADDLLRGQFYRPMLEGASYGGTRYMPLFFGLLAGFVSLIGDHVVAGCLFFQLTVGILVLALWATLREIGAPPGCRLPLAGLVLCTATYQDAWFTPRCEYLVSALALLVLLCLIRYERGGSSWWLAGCGLAATLAFFVKTSAIVVIVVPLAWLVRRRRGAQAMVLLVATLSACALGLVAVEALSGGRFLESVLATMWGSGRPGSAARFFRSFLNDEIWGDPFMGVMLGTAVVGSMTLIRPGVPSSRLLVVLFALVALAETLVLHTGDGIVAHHNVWLHVCCLLVFGCLLSRGGIGPSLVRLGCGVSLAMFLATWLPGVDSVREHQARWSATSRPRILDLLKDVPIGAHYYASNPMLPLARGERPVALEFAHGSFLTNWAARGEWWFDVVVPYLPEHLRGFRQKAQAVARDFERRAMRGEFVAIVLTDWEHVVWQDLDEPGRPLPERQENDLWASQYPAFQALRSSYRIARVRRPYVLLVPSGQASAAAPRAASGPP